MSLSKSLSVEAPKGNLPAAPMKDFDVNELRSRSTSEVNQDGRKEEKVVEYKRKVGLLSAVCFNIGTMIGSGIFISPKGVLENTGSVGLSLIIWTLCGAVTMMQALSVAEITNLIKKSGGDYSYLMGAYGPLHRFLGPLPAFLNSWLSTFVGRPSNVGIISLTCAKYALAPFYNDECGEPPVLASKMFAAMVLLILAAVNCLSVKAGSRVQVIFTAAKLVAVFIIIVGGIVRLAQGHTTYLNNAFTGSTSNIGLIAIGFYQGLWAFSGSVTVNGAVEEMVNPSRNLPLCVYLVVPFVTLCYLLMNISYFTVMSPGQLLASPAVAVTWGHVTMEGAAFLIPLFVAFSTFGATNSNVFMQGRTFVAYSRNGHTLGVLSMLHATRCTPTPGIMLGTLITLLWMIPGDVDSFVNAFSFVNWLTNGAIMAGILIMRYTHRNEKRVYKVPLLFPIVVLLISVYLVLAPVIDNPRMEFLYALAMMAAGVVVYTVFVYFRKEVPGLRYLTVAVQLILQVAPSRENLL